MKAVYIQEFGGPENLEIREVPDPSAPTGNEVLVEVKAAALNRADILQRRGLYPAPAGYPERIPGLEFAGTVSTAGPEAVRFKAGDRVFGITAGGAQAGMILVKDDQITAVPPGLDLTEAAAVPEAFITAHDALIVQGGLDKDETALIHAVGSGVGLAALQLAKARGAKVIGTSRTTDKLERCKALGLDVSISAEEYNDFSEVVLRETEGKGADIILDLVGGKYFGQNLKSLAQKGRLMLVGLVGGASADFDLRLALQKRLTIIGTVLRSRTDEEKAAASSAFERDVIPLFESGKIRPNVDRVFRLEEIREAHEYLESNESFGKVVIEIGGQ